MRELKVGAVDSGLADVFNDVATLARSCRFRDCTHAGDAGCAVEAAVTSGQLDARRYASFMKLQRERRMPRDPCAGDANENDTSAECTGKPRCSDAATRGESKA